MIKCVKVVGMIKCVCGHNETEHVSFARKLPCAHALCLCEDFDFGGAQPKLTDFVDACQPADCQVCLYPECPNKAKHK